MPTASSTIWFAKNYIVECEERHGLEAVERMLDAAHALMNHGVFRYRRPQHAQPRRRAAARPSSGGSTSEATYNDLWRTVPKANRDEQDDRGDEKQHQEIKRRLGLPEENLLYFLEKNAPRLEPGSARSCASCASIAQYFYPQRQTK